MHTMYVTYDLDVKGKTGLAGADINTQWVRRPVSLAAGVTNLEASIKSSAQPIGSMAMVWAFFSMGPNIYIIVIIGRASSPHCQYRTLQPIHDTCNTSP